MKFVSFLCISVLFALSTAHAADFDFNYEIKTNSKNHTPTFTQFLKKQGYTTFTEKTNRPIPGLHIEQMAMAPNKKDMVLFKNGIVSSKKNLIGKVIKHPKGYLYHGADYAIFFTHERRADVEHFLKKLNKTSFAFSLQFFPKAHAYCPACESAAESVMGRTAHSSLSQAAQLADQAANESLAKASFECMGQMWDGFETGVNGTIELAGKAIKGLGSGIKKLFTDPAGLWNKTVDGAKAVWKIAKKIPAQVKSMVAGLSDFDFNVQRAFVCNVVGILGAEGALALVTGGAMAGKLSLVITKLGAQFQKAKGLLAWMKKLPDSKSKNKDMEYIVSNLNKYPDGHLDAVNDLSSIGMGKQAREVATCAL